MGVLKHKDADGWNAILALPSSKYGDEPPTESFSADYIGQVYLDRQHKTVWICTAIEGTIYTWTSFATNPDGKEDRGKLTLNGTSYDIKVQTGDFGTEGCITFVIQ